MCHFFSFGACGGLIVDKRATGEISAGAISADDRPTRSSYLGSCYVPLPLYILSLHTHTVAQEAHQNGAL